MDVLGLLAVVVAVGAFPGGMFLAAGSVVAARLSGAEPRGARSGWTAGEFGAVVAVTLAAALLPLPGSPVASLPPDSGVLSNLAGIGLLVAVALAAAEEPGPWTVHRRIAAVAAAAPVFAVGSAAASLAFPVVLSVPTTAAARVLAGMAILVSAPVIAGVGVAGSAREPRAAILTVLTLTGALLVAPSPVLAAPAVAVAGFALFAVALMAVCGRRLHGGRRELGPTIAALTLATASVVASMVAGR